MIDAVHHVGITIPGVDRVGRGIAPVIAAVVIVERGLILAAALEIDARFDGVLAIHLGQVVADVDGGVVVDERGIGGSEGGGVREVRSVHVDLRNVTVLHGIGIEQREIHSRTGGGERVAGFVDIDAVLGHADVQLVGHGGADDISRSTGETVTWRIDMDRVERNGLAEYKRAIYVRHGLSVVDVMAENTQILRHVVIHAQEIFAARNLFRYLGGVVVADSRGVRHGKQLSQLLAGQVDLARGDNVTGDGKLRIGVPDGESLAVVVDALREITGAFERSGHLDVFRRVGSQLELPFLAPEKV